MNWERVYLPFLRRPPSDACRYPQCASFGNVFALLSPNAWWETEIGKRLHISIYEYIITKWIYPYEIKTSKPHKIKYHLITSTRVILTLWAICSLDGNTSQADQMQRLVSPLIMRSTEITFSSSCSHIQLQWNF